ncbi:MAG: M15 family metallopeptidase [Myxococcales bacterium]|nr:M15 family metallopeptidase [Myxococcales bacterium]
MSARLQKWLKTDVSASWNHSGQQRPPVASTFKQAGGAGTLTQTLTVTLLLVLPQLSHAHPRQPKATPEGTPTSTVKARPSPQASVLPRAGLLPHATISLCKRDTPLCAAIAMPAGRHKACWGPHGEALGHGVCRGKTQCCKGVLASVGGCGACVRGKSIMRYQPKFSGAITPIGDKLGKAMTGVSWRKGCPVDLRGLRLLTMHHWRPNGTIGRGQLIVNATVAKGVLKAFERLFQMRFPITRMIPVHRYGASDDRSMKADNTSAFNCRKITGGSRWSEHAFGTAIDINPLRNPYVKGKLVLPAEGRAWASRTDVRPGMLVPHGPTVGVWRQLGWGWGGTWRKLQDFQHVSQSGK